MMAIRARVQTVVVNPAPNEPFRPARRCAAVQTVGAAPLQWSIIK